MWRSLFELVHQRGKNKISIQAIVDSLPAQPRIAELMSFILEATDVSKSNLPLDGELENFQFFKDEILQSIESIADRQDEPKTYPISEKSFFGRFSQFVHAFVMKYGEAFFAPDNGFKDFVDFIPIVLLSDYMPFRHTATLACLKIITAGAHIGSRIKNDIEAVDSENSSEESPRDLTGILDSLKEDFRNVKSALRELCAEVKERYIDASDTIRELCLKEAAVWCKDLLPIVGVKIFCKELPCLLVDSKKMVRQQALQVAVTLFRCRDDLPVEMIVVIVKLFGIVREQLRLHIYNEDESHACVAFQTMVQAFRFIPDAIPIDVVNELLLHVYTKRSVIADEAGTFLKVVIEKRAEHAVERLRELLKFSAERAGGEACVFHVLNYASCEWFFHSARHMRVLLQDTINPLSMNERRSLIVFLGFLVRKLATDDIPSRQRVPETKVLKNLVPLPRTDQRLQPLPPVVLEEFPHILRLCTQQDRESRIYLVRLLQFMTFDKPSEEQVELITWLRKAFDESKDFEELEEISRALTALARQGTVKPFQRLFDEICKSVFDEAANALKLVHDQRFDDENTLLRLWSVMIEVSALLTHGNLDLIVTAFIADTSNLLQALGRHKYATTPIRMQLMETSLQILHCYHFGLYKLICGDSSESFVLNPESLEFKELQKNVNSCITYGSYLVLKKETAVGLRIYPIVCDFLADMVRLDFSDSTVKKFVAASKRVFEIDVFQRDGEGNFIEEERGLNILRKFSRVVRSGAVSISELPPVFHLYTKCCDSYDEVLKNMLLAKGSYDNEPYFLVAILRSVQEAYRKDGIGSSQKIARKLALLFGEPTERDTLQVFHETLLIICLSLNRSGWDDDTTTFAHQTATNFATFVRNLSSEQLSDHLATKIPDFHTVSSNTDIKKYVKKYVQLIEKAREGLAINMRERPNVNSSRC